MERYIIEAKDQDGWFDYASYSNLDEAKTEATALRESFGEHVHIIDSENMVEFIYLNI